MDEPFSLNTKCSAYMAVSVDGFIAREDGDIDWLHKPEYGEPDPLGLRYEDFIASVDTLVMGRRSFEKVLTFPEWPYEATPVVVLTRRELDVPRHLGGRVRTDGGEPQAVVSRLKSDGERHLYIDGGVAVQRFLAAGLLTDLTLTRLPVILGRGIPLFGSVGTEIPLRHVETTVSGNGFVQSRYRVDEDTAG